MTGVAGFNLSLSSLSPEFRLQVSSLLTEGCGSEYRSVLTFARSSVHGQSITLFEYSRKVSILQDGVRST